MAPHPVPPLRSYLISGVGQYRMHESSDTRRQFGVNGGAGVRISSVDRLWFFEIRIHRTMEMSSAYWIPATIGVRF